MPPRSRRRIEQSGIPVPGESEEDGPVGRQPQGPQQAQGRRELQKFEKEELERRRVDEEERNKMEDISTKYHKGGLKETFSSLDKDGSSCLTIN
jgi:hypothetical protein